MGPSQMWNGCPLVAILNLPGQPYQTAPFLLTFSSALLGGRNVNDPACHELSMEAAFVIGMLHSFSCREGDGKLVQEGAVGKTSAGGASCLLLGEP